VTSRFCLALVLAVPAIVGAGSAAPATKLSTSGAIVFSSDRDGDWDIYAVNADGTGLRQLTHNDVEDSSPLPSPNGKLIAIFSEQGGLVVMNADGSGRRSLRDCGLIPQSWSPDSTRLACEGSGGEGVAVADLARGTVTALSARGDELAWSPDGRTIAYVDAGLWVVPADGGSPRRLSRRSMYERPSWSPDSRRLAYAGSVGTGLDLFTIAADGSAERRLVKNIETFGTSWSPQGSVIAFTRSVGRGHVAAIYTVRAEGTGSRRVTPSSGGESSTGPSWSADGSELLYERQRYLGARDGDVFVISPGARAGRALTRPFPTGGTNGEPRWLTGPSLATTPKPGPRTMSLPTARTLAFPVIQTVAADGAHAAIAYGGCGIAVWEPLARRTTRLPSACNSETNRGQIVLAGTRVAWIGESFGNTEDFTELMTLRVGDRRAARMSATSAYSSDGFSTLDGGSSLAGLHGGGGTIAFTMSRYDKASETDRAWLLLAGRGVKCPGVSGRRDRCRRLSGGDVGVTAAVDGGRVVTIAPDGTVRLLATSGKVLRTWSLGPGVEAVRLQARTLAVQKGSSLVLYDTATGAMMGTRPLADDGGQPARLLDVHGDLAVYETGGAVHLLRLSDGRDRALAIPRAAPPFDAQLESSGLFVYWNRMFSSRPGRFAFVPLRTIVATIAASASRSTR
jgi:TolB protein